MPKFEYEGFEELDHVLQRLPELALDSAELAMPDATLYIHENIPDYPPASAESFAPDGWSFVSEKQRRFFFASVREGKIPGWKWQIEEVTNARGETVERGHPQKVGSARTGTLGRRFTEQTTRGDKAVTGMVGTNVPYAPWVVGPDYPGESIRGQMMFQARVHAKRWWQFYDVFENSADGAWEVFEERFWKELQERWAND